MKRAIVIVLFAAACGKHSNQNNGTPDAPAAGGDAMSDNGPCSPEALRCNGNTIEQCNATGTNWVPQQVCQTYCLDAQCALDGLDVASDQQMDGTVVVKGVVHVHDGATLSSPSGDLTIIADEIDVDSGGTISVAPTGMSPLGRGPDGTTQFGSTYYYDGAGGGYATNGSGPNQDGATWGLSNDSDVEPGSPGGKAATGTNPTNAPGGGALRLLASKIVIAGQLTANGANGSLEMPCGGGGGGGSGGGILVAGDDVTVSGSISAAGGSGGHVTTCSGVTDDGGQGRVKILFGSAHAITGSITGVQTVGLAPPYPLGSDTHADPTVVYNDDFTALDASWPKPFASVQGYYVLVDRSPSTVPTPSNATFVATTSTSFPPMQVMAGTNYIHVTSVDAMSNVGTIQTSFAVTINSTPPSLTSSSHPNQTQFSTNTNPYFTWSYPQGVTNVTKAYYVFDHYGTTIPTTADTMLPASQQQLLESNVANGVWVLHVVAADAAGRLTKLAGHYRVNIGPDPGNGAINGHVVNGAQPVQGATVTVNRGLYTATTDANGNYSLPQVTAGTWEISATSGTLSATKMSTIPAGTSTTVDLTF